MVAYLARKGVIPSLSLPTIIGAALAMIMFVLALALPGWRLEQAVSESGLPAVLPAAAPPLGATARAAIGFFGAVLIGGGGWLATRLAMEVRPKVRRPRSKRPVLDASAPPPAIRRADAHPDAAPRPPVLAASELGVPLWDDAPAPTPAPVVAAPIERSLPDDLDQPLAAFDPDAIPEKPMPMPRFAAHERIETFELTPPPPAREQAVAIAIAAAQPADDPLVAPGTDATIQSLLDRLERGVARRTTRSPAPRPRAIDDALIQLRRMATR
ncbi:hypothetical protein ACPVPU_11360 [Sphingomonas sp. CJ99]